MENESQEKKQIKWKKSALLEKYSGGSHDGRTKDMSGIINMWKKRNESSLQKDKQKL